MFISLNNWWNSLGVLLLHPALKETIVSTATILEEIMNKEGKLTEMVVAALVLMNEE